MNNKFVMSEIKVIEDIIEEGNVLYKDIKDVIPLLAKYFCQIEGMNKNECYDEIVSFLNKACPDYFREANQMFYIEKCIGYAQNVTLIDVKEINITKKEMDTIRSIGSKPLERLAFVMLVCCKYHMAARGGTSHWVGYEHSDIFRMARIKGTVFENEMEFHKLCKLGLLTPSGISGKCALKVNYIDEDPNSEIALTLHSMKELSLEYQNYIGEGRFIRCKDCGILVKVGKKNTSTCRCSQCQAEYRREYNAEMMRKNREK